LKKSFDVDKFSKMTTTTSNYDLEMIGTQNWLLIKFLWERKLSFFKVLSSLATKTWSFCIFTQFIFLKLNKLNIFETLRFKHQVNNFSIRSFFNLFVTQYEILPRIFELVLDYMLSQTFSVQFSDSYKKDFLKKNPCYFQNQTDFSKRYFW